MELEEDKEIISPLMIEEGESDIVEGPSPTQVILDVLGELESKGK